MNFLYKKNIIIGITGGIAAYKTAYLIRQLKDLGANIKVVMTKTACEFVTPLTFQALTGDEVLVDSQQTQTDSGMLHIQLAKWADIIVIAPATANCIASLAHGNANNLLTTICLASVAIIAVAPAMNSQMWEQKSTKSNIEILRNNGLLLWGPANGIQACGDVGEGRMEEPAAIVQRLQDYFSTGELAGKTIVITAGPTREPIDPMRYLSNRSSGKMGYALAQAAIEMGARVELISGPVHIAPPNGCSITQVETAMEMLEAVNEKITGSDWFISCAAVADYRPSEVSNQKIKKSSDKYSLDLTLNPDILSTVASATNRPDLVIGFAAETNDLETNAIKKLHKKNLDIIIMNKIGKGEGVEVDENMVTMLWSSNNCLNKYPFELMSKTKLAKQVLQKLVKISVE